MELEIKIKRKIEQTYTIYKNVSKKAIREEMDLDRDEDPEDYVLEYIEQVYTDLTDLIDDEAWEHLIPSTINVGQSTGRTNIITPSRVTMGVPKTRSLVPFINRNLRNFQRLTR